jgi:hypothetical protein
MTIAALAAAGVTFMTAFASSMMPMSVAAMMFPAVPTFAAAEAETTTEFVADDVPAGPVPAVVVPRISLTLGDIGVAYVIAALGDRHVATRRHHHVGVDQDARRRHFSKRFAFEPQFAIGSQNQNKARAETFEGVYVVIHLIPAGRHGAKGAALQP